MKGLRRGTLSRQLILSTTALVAVVAVALSGLTALSMHSILQAQLDEQIVSTAARWHDDRPGLPLGGGAGQAQGLLFYVQGGSGFVQVDSDQDVVAGEIATELESLTPTGELQTRRLSGLGTYRLSVTQQGSGVLVVGLPTSGLNASMTSILVAAGVLTVLAIAVAFLAARALVERSLRPLARVAGTATQVSHLELDRGEVALPVRVEPADADPRSEVGQVGLALNHLLDNVEEALAARQRSEMKVRQFVADASHELRNPLASIRGYAELTRRERPSLPENTAHALTRIESESERMSRLVEDLLLLARLDSGPAVAVVATSLDRIVADSISDARAAGPDHVWSLALPEDDVLVLGDPHRLTQVVTNLLANARTHTPPGTRVHAAVTREPGWAVLTVTDDGPGISPDVVDRVFERFTRGDVSRVRAGGGVQSTGLGLAIVAAVVEAHHGRVGVSSQPGFTQFTVRLPLAP